MALPSEAKPRVFSFSRDRQLQSDAETQIAGSNCHAVSEGDSPLARAKRSIRGAGSRPFATAQADNGKVLGKAGDYLTAAQLQPNIRARFRSPPFFVSRRGKGRHRC